jgi:hypothetical protein
MKIIGCDFHTRYQQIAMLDEATGELIERRLDHESGEAQAFYRDLQGPVRVGIEATGPIRWFERLLAELGHELWIGDAAKIRASEVRKQKTDERDALLILDLLLAKRFPKIWVPTPAERDLRQLLWHRHKLVCMPGASSLTLFKGGFLVCISLFTSKQSSHKSSALVRRKDCAARIPNPRPGRWQFIPGGIKENKFVPPERPRVYK